MGWWLRREAGAAEVEAVQHAIIARVTSDWWQWRLLANEMARARLVAPTGLGYGDIWQQG
jgi:hypothetical protein